MDALDLASVDAAVAGCEVVYYLIHSMIAGGRGGFAEADRTAALNMAAVAAVRKVKRIIYLGGLGETEHPDLSEHLKSRHEVEEIFNQGDCAGNLSAGRHDSGCRQRLVRDASLPGGAPAGHGNAQMGRYALPAHRHPRCSGISARLPWRRPKPSAGLSTSAGRRCSVTVN